MGASHPIPRVSSSSQSHAAFEGNKGSQHCSGLQPHTRSLPAAPHAASPSQLRAPPGQEEGLTQVKGQGSTVPTEQQGGGLWRAQNAPGEERAGCYGHPASASPPGAASLPLVVRWVLTGSGVGVPYGVWGGGPLLTNTHTWNTGTGVRLKAPGLVPGRRLRPGRGTVEGRPSSGQEVTLMTEEGARPCRSQATHPSPPQGAAQELGILSSSWPPHSPAAPWDWGGSTPKGLPSPTSLQPSPRAHDGSAYCSIMPSSWPLRRLWHWRD